MKENDIESLENETIFIGKVIEEELHRQDRTVTWLSRKIHCDRRNIYDIFSRTNIDTDLLYRLSIALQKDFFAYFSANLQLHVNQLLTSTSTHSITQQTATRQTASNLPGITTPVLGNTNNNLSLTAPTTGSLNNTQHPDYRYSPDSIL